MSRRESGPWGRWSATALLVAAAAIFSFLNSGERVTLNAGFTTFYRISLVGLVFGSFLLGMLTMFLFGLRHDRRIRDALRQHYSRDPGESPRNPDIHHDPTPPTELPP